MDLLLSTKVGRMEVVYRNFGHRTEASVTGAELSLPPLRGQEALKHRQKRSEKDV